MNNKHKQSPTREYFSQSEKTTERSLELAMIQYNITHFLYKQNCSIQSGKLTVSGYEEATDKAQQISLGRQGAKTTPHDVSYATTFRSFNGKTCGMPHWLMKTRFMVLRNILTKAMNFHVRIFFEPQIVSMNEKISFWYRLSLELNAKKEPIIRSP